MALMLQCERWRPFGRAAESATARSNFVSFVIRGTQIRICASIVVAMAFCQPGEGQKPDVVMESPFNKSGVLRGSIARLDHYWFPENQEIPNQFKPVAEVTACGKRWSRSSWIPIGGGLSDIPSVVSTIENQRPVVLVSFWIPTIVASPDCGVLDVTMRLESRDGVVISLGNKLITILELRSKEDLIISQAYREYCASNDVCIAFDIVGFQERQLTEQRSTLSGSRMDELIEGRTTERELWKEIETKTQRLAQNSEVAKKVFVRERCELSRSDYREIFSGRFSHGIPGGPNLLDLVGSELFFAFCNPSSEESKLKAAVYSGPEFNSLISEMKASTPASATWISTTMKASRQGKPFSNQE
ncbi:MAG: hypothetical protein KAJ78_04660 [Acidobacteria bacterium]|nr:hypothetical protein [Acidobacteriota bacterium]